MTAPELRDEVDELRSALDDLLYAAALHKTTVEDLCFVARGVRGASAVVERVQRRARILDAAAEKARLVLDDSKGEP